MNGRHALSLLHRLERNGLVEGFWGKAATGRRRKSYRLTPAGAEELLRHRRQWRIVDRTMKSILFLAVDPFGKAI